MDKEKIKRIVPFAIITLVILVAFLAFFRTKPKPPVEDNPPPVVVEEDNDNPPVEEQPVVHQAGVINRYGFTVARPANWVEGQNRLGSILTVYRSDDPSTYYAIMHDRRYYRSFSDYSQYFSSQASVLVPGLSFSSASVMGTNYVLEGGGANYVTAIILLPAQDDRVWVLSFNTPRERWLAYQSDWTAIKNSFSLQP